MTGFIWPPEAITFGLSPLKDIFADEKEKITKGCLLSKFLTKTTINSYYFLCEVTR